MTDQPGAMLYTQSFGSRPEGVEVPIYQTRAPSTSDWNYPIGKQWVDQSGLATYQLVAVTSSIGVNSATWISTGGGTTELSTLTGDSGTAVPSAGNIKLAGTANQITTTASGATVTFSVPSAFIAPGSIASTTTITAGTGLTVTTGGLTVSAGTTTLAALTQVGTASINASGAGVTTIGTGGSGAVNIGNATGNTAVTGSLTASTSLTATLGNISAANGNFVASTAGTGIVLKPGTVSGTTTGTINARSGQITITTPSIAGGATFTFTVTNSSITDNTTQIIYALSGGTTGSALSIQSYANTAGQSVVTINNGTGATTNTASLILNFLVLN